MEFREFVKLLESKGMLTRITKQVDSEYEISTLIKLLDGKPLLFEKVKGYDMPVIANICVSRDLVALGLGVERLKLIPYVANAIDHPKKYEVDEATDYVDIGTDLTKLPILTYYRCDGGRYFSSAIAIAQDKEYGLNASYHRAMMFKKKDKAGNDVDELETDKLVLRILERDLDAYIKRGLNEFAFCVGNSIQVLVGAAISAAIDVDEMQIANAMAPTKMVRLGGHVVPNSEIVMIMEFTGEEHEEGKFVDLTETVDIIRMQRVARVKHIFVRRGAMFQALLPGGLEHKVLMGMPREPTMYTEVGKVTEVKDVLVTPGGTSWLHGVVSIKKRHPDDGINAIHAAFKGHKSMKHVFIVDDDIDINDPNQVEWAMATRFQGKRGMVMFEDKGSSLDPSSDMATRLTTKIGFDLTIPPEEKPKEGETKKPKKEFQKPPLPLQLKVGDYLPKK